MRTVKAYMHACIQAYIFCRSRSRIGPHPRVRCPVSRVHCNSMAKVQPRVQRTTNVQKKTKARRTKANAVAYMRTSSKANMHGDSQGRQLHATQARANQQGVTSNQIAKVGECVSGMAPMAHQERRGEKDLRGECQPGGTVCQSG